MRQAPRLPLRLSTASLLALSLPLQAAPPEIPSERLEILRQQLAEQAQRLDELKRSIANEEARMSEALRALGLDALAERRGTGSQLASAAAEPAPAATRPSETEPLRDNNPQPANVAQIFEQSGILTPQRSLVLEPSLQYSYSSSNRIALVGYTIIPAILIGVIDVREVKRNTFTGTLSARYGLSSRLEIEARVPYVRRSDSSIGREILKDTGFATNVAFDSSGHGIGDVELGLRYQLNDGGVDKPFYVAGLRLKTRTGRDPFEVETNNSVNGLRDGVQAQLPTGSGFYGLQPSLTVLYPSDPAVLFGSISYLHSFKRDNVVRKTNNGPQELGSIQPGGVLGFNFGMGLALNERSSFSIGYDHSSVAKTKQNGVAAADAVRVQLGTLLLGYAYRLGPKRTLNITLGAGMTRDTPDITLTVRMPMNL